MKLFKFKELAEQLLTEEKLLKSRITPRRLQALQNRGLAEIRMHRGKIIAFGALWPTYDATWYELGSVWVHPAWRQRSIATELFSNCVQKNDDKNIFLITRSIKIVHLAHSHEMEEAFAWSENSFWQSLCVPWDDLPSKGSRVLPKEGRLFFKKSST